MKKIFKSTITNPVTGQVRFWYSMTYTAEEAQQRAVDSTDDITPVGELPVEYDIVTEEVPSA
jgi:hypothetical protein